MHRPSVPLSAIWGHTTIAIFAAATVYLPDAQGDMACWGYALYQPGTPAIDHMCDGSYGVGIQLRSGTIRSTSRSDFDGPCGSSVRTSVAYRHYYGIAPRYDAEQYALVFPRQPARCSRSWRGSEPSSNPGTVHRQV